MSYSTTNPPFLLLSAVGGGFQAGSSDAGGSLWHYRSSDVEGTVEGSSYFSNGAALGMRVNDVVFIIDTAGALSIGRVSAVTAGAGATVVVGSLTST